MTSSSSALFHQRHVHHLSLNCNSIGDYLKKKKWKDGGKNGFSSWRCSIRWCPVQFAVELNSRWRSIRAVFHHPFWWTMNYLSLFSELIESMVECASAFINAGHDFGSMLTTGSIKLTVMKRWWLVQRCSNFFYLSYRIDWRLWNDRSSRWCNSIMNHWLISQFLANIYAVSQ